MADEILKRDQNHVTVLAGVTDDSDLDITMLRVDPITKRLLVKASISEGVVTSINGLTGAITLAEGAGISITPSGNTLTIAATSGVSWSLTGNTGTTAGTNFIGTTDDVDFVVKRNSIELLRFGTDSTTITRTIVDPTTNIIGLSQIYTINNTANSANGITPTGLRSLIRVTDNFLHTGDTFIGSFLASSYAGAGTVETFIGGYGEAKNESTGTMSYIAGLASNTSNDTTGTVDNAVGLFIDIANNGGGTLNTGTGVLIDSLAGTTKIGISADIAGSYNIFRQVNLNASSPLRFYDSDSSNYVSLQAPNIVASDTAYTLPNAFPAGNGYALVSTTAGVMSWTAISGSSSTVTIPINNLLAATGTNTIDNGTLLQEWQWNSLTTGTALKLSSSSVTTGALLTLTSTKDQNSSTNLLSLNTNGGFARSGPGISFNNTAGGQGMQLVYSGGNSYSENALTVVYSSTAGLTLMRNSVAEMGFQVGVNLGGGVAATIPQATLHVKSTNVGIAGNPITGIKFEGVANTQVRSELVDIDFNMARSVQYRTNTYALARSFVIRPPTISALGASTFTDAATMAITGAPIESTNATLTNTHALLIHAGAVSTATNSYGLTVNAQTGATNNYAAAFLGGYVGVGTSAPSTGFEVVGNDFQASRGTFTLYSADATAPGFIGRKARGNSGSPAAVQTGDGLVTVAARGYTSAGSFPAASTGNFIFYAAENFTSSAQGTYFTLGTTTIGTTTLVERLRVTDVGAVGIGITSPTAVLHLKAGTATANTAPLKFTAPAALLSVTEALTIEPAINGDYLNFTTTTGTIRRVIVAGNSGRATGQTAANASVATYTLGATDASYEVSANVLVTTSSAEAFTVTVDYTDEGNTARTVTLNFSLVAGTIGTNIAFANGAVPYEGIPLHIRCKASTAITIKTAAGGTYTGCTYNVEGTIKQIA